MHNLRTAPYNQLSLVERVNALDQAKQDGQEAMLNDLVADGVEIDAYEMPSDDIIRRSYLLLVVEPAWQLDLCSDEELEYWKMPQSLDDPRLDAFLAGWKTGYQWRGA